jgi:thiol-disulfide isomerase/thioredoxin
MLIRNMEFSKLEKEISEPGASSLDYLAPEIGKVYVVAISRDRCPACERQKPRLDSLAKSTVDRHGKTVVFTRIRVRHPTEKDIEVTRSKDLLGHYFFPTDLILVRTKDRGAVELFKIVSPRMSELKRYIEVSVEIAAMLKDR